MECPICYCSQAICKLACKHSFCFDCVKKWYIKCPDESMPSCPMCRKNMYFKGINSKIYEWEDEYREDMFQQVFEKHLEDLLEDVDHLTIPVLKHISERFRKMKEYDLKLSEDDINYFIFHEFETFTYPREYRDIPTWKRLITAEVSKHSQHPNKKTNKSCHRGFRDFPEEMLLVVFF